MKTPSPPSSSAEASRSSSASASAPSPAFYTPTLSQRSLQSRLHHLRSASTIPLSSLPLHLPSSDGLLVVLQNAVVAPLSSLPDLKDKHPQRLFSSSGRESVLIWTAEYTDQPKEFADVYRGINQVYVSRVPFALVASGNRGGSDSESNESSFVIVNANANECHLPLAHDSCTTSPLNPPVFLTRKIAKKQMVSEIDHQKLSVEIEHEASELFQVNKVTRQSVLGAGTRLENVFGRLRARNSLGFPEIEPCPWFPNECFTMSKAQIKRKVEADAMAFKVGCVGLQVMSFGLIFTGMASIVYGSTFLF